MVSRSLLNAKGCTALVCMTVRAMASTISSLETISGVVVVLQDLRAKLLCFSCLVQRFDEAFISTLGNQLGKFFSAAG